MTDSSEFDDVHFPKKIKILNS